MGDVVIKDCSTGQRTVRPMTAQEQAQRDADVAAALAREAAEAARPDPVAELVAAVDAATTVAGLRNALKTHLPRAFGRDA